MTLTTDHHYHIATSGDFVAYGATQDEAVCQLFILMGETGIY